MAYAKISHVAHYVPEQIISNDDLAKIMDTSDEWISSRTGIRRRHISKNQSTSDLATEVAKQLLEKSGKSAEEFDFIIVATVTPDSMMPTTAARVQANIGAKNAFVFDMTAACSGFVFALATADKFIQSGLYQTGLVIGAETMSKSMDWTDRGTAVLFGDGAGGVILEASEKKYFLGESLNSDGSRGASLTSGLTALASPYSDREEVNQYLTMDGRAVFDFALKDVTKSIKQLIEETAVSVDDIDYLLLHQANIRILDKMAKKIGIDRAKFPANMAEYGNTSAASIPILLSECVDKGLIRLDGSQTVLLAGFGGGLTWGAILLTL